MVDMADDRARYARPPATEAIVELRFEEALSDRDLERCRDRFKKDYPKVEEISEVTVQLQPGGKASQTATRSGVKLTAASAQDVLMLTRHTIGTIRLAPYTSWDILIAQTRQNNEVLEKLVGRKRIARVGTRFINRVDIPLKSFNNTRGWVDFITVRPMLPAPLEIPVDAYYMNVQAALPGSPAKTLIQAGPLNPVLLDHQSFQLDIDVYFEGEIPQRLEDMWALVGSLRQIKNTVFESCVTDQAREFFK
jgi:uncharacterized protein (TIGR04255 family)